MASDDKAGFVRDVAAAEPAWDVALLFPRQGQWTEEDYLSLSTNHRVELSGGVLEVPDMPTDRHQAIVASLFLRLHAFVADLNLGTVRFAALPVRLWPGKFREPDVVFLAREHSDRIHEQYWGVPDLVMEVVSPGTRRLDEVIKIREYAEAGIPEYWLADPEAGAIAVHRLEQGAYELLVRATGTERALSAVVPGFAVTADEIFAAR